MTTKLFLVFLSATAGTMGGLSLSNRSASRERYFEQLCNLVDRLISDIRFSQQRIEEIITDAHCSNRYLAANVEEYMAFIAGGGELLLSRGVLTARESGMVKEFFLRLGTLDLDTQIGELNCRKEAFCQLKAAAAAKNKSFGRAYIKLGFLAGLLVGLLLL